MTSLSHALPHDEEPIVALASGAQTAAIAVLRLSGHGCHELARPCLRLKGGQQWQKNRLHLCLLQDPKDQEVLDEPMAVFFYAPHSYTGQDSLEIYLHGGQYIIQKALALFYKQGFRPAEAGEFTRRAYLAGKMDLTQAEGIQELIAASSHQQWLAARQLATGKLQQRIEELRQLVMEAMAWLAARIDFPDEQETSQVEMQAVDERVARVKQAMTQLQSSYEGGRVASQGLRVALCGPPNAGKSSLMNQLLGNERAIVTPIAGTTRDFLEESCLIQGRLIRLIDTAGMRESSCEVERLGIERAKAIAREADIVLFLAACDGDENTPLEIAHWLEALRPRSHMTLLTKSDLALPSWYAPEAHKQWLRLSCQTGAGLQQLQAELAGLVDQQLHPLEKEEAFITSARHKFALEQAYEALHRFEEARAQGAYDDMLAFELQQLAKALGSIIGHWDADELLGVVFQSFCVGK